MAFQPVPLTAKVTVKMLQGTEVVENIFYVHNGSAWTLTSLAEVADAFLVWLGAQLFPILNNETSVVDVTATDQSSEAGGTVSLIPGTPIRGGHDERGEPNNATFAIKHTTGVSGRWYHGRTFVPGLSTIYIANSQMSSAAANALVSAFDTLNNALTVLGYDWVVVSRWLHGVQRAEGISTHITGNSYSDLAVDSQRCRLPGHRRKRRVL